MAGEKILIIDDDLANLRVLQDYLEHSGFEVLTAPNAESAHSQLHSSRPDLILLDVLMPGTDGFEICLQLKQDERTREIPVIFMTALSDEINKVRGFEVGGVDYLTKPLHYQETLIRIETHLNMQKLQQQLRSQNIQLEQQNVRLQQEISERKQTEKELKHTIQRIELAKQEWESTADSLSHLVCLLDEQGHILRANRTVEHWKLGQVATVKGTSVHDLLHPNCALQRCALHDFFQRALESVTANHAWEQELKDPLFNRYLSLQVRPISTNTRRKRQMTASFAVCVVHDITERKRMEQALQQRTRELSLLNQLSDQLQSCQTEEETYHILVKMCAQLFPYTSGSFCIMNAEQTGLTRVASWGNPPDSLHTFGIDDSWVFVHDNTRIVEQPYISKLCPHIGYSPDKKHLCAPIHVAGKMLAILAMSLEFDLPLPGQSDEQIDCRGMTEQEFQQKLSSIEIVLTGVVEHYALSLVNLRLQERLRKEAIVDPLTGLYNRRHMEASLKRESRRAQRHNSSLGFMMLDVDRFKILNDTYTHEAGDIVLQELGLLLQRHIRGEDIACRYGGEEFLLILPEASLLDTLQRAEELRFMVRELGIRYHDSILHITISIGVAALPEHGHDPKDVLNAADMALYQAKDQGRDCVVVASK
ncbi:MAG: diguanylate cyclase [Candidatus Vecturithrix sp.]|jgi:diguanylate cyclase (GGDEF)-like protein/PAS domain S-box-containing protein|nr:diguanylate cyclase [Candidatus Vecturithrix sp.]